MTFGWVDCRKRRQLATTHSWYPLPQSRRCGGATRNVDYGGRHIRQYSNKYYVVQDVPEGSVGARR